MKKWIAGVLAFCMSLGMTACGTTPDNSSSESSTDSSSISNSSSSSSNQWEGSSESSTNSSTDTTTSDSSSDNSSGDSGEQERTLMWNTEALFSTRPTLSMMPELNLGSGISAFKFKAAPTATKTETWVFGALGVPTTPMPSGGYPAVVLVHGGAGFVRTGWIEYWNKQGFVAIAIDMWGNQLDANGNKVSNPDSGFVEREPYYDGVENPEYSWVYHSVYNVIMAHNIVRSQPFVNVQKTAITGISWGGYITSIVSGVDTRFKAVAPVYGCGYIYEDSFWTDRYASVFGSGGVWNSADKQKWIELYDPSSYVPYATAPMFFVSGTNDICFSTTGRMRTADLYQGEKAFYSQRYGFDHGDYWEVTYEIYAFFRHILYGDNTLSDIQGITVNNNVATLNYSNAKFGVVNFIYTTSTDADSHKWTWNAVTVYPVNGTYSFTIPAGTTAYYYETMTMDDKLHQSTKIMFTNM